MDRIFGRVTGLQAEAADDEPTEESTENGDAYWAWSAIDYVPVPSPKSFTELVPDVNEQKRIVQDALGSFGNEDAQAGLREAWQEVVGSDPGNPDASRS